MAKKKKNSSKQSNAPVERDDGTRWQVIDLDGKPVYPGGKGVSRKEAERLADGLYMVAKIKQIK